MIMTWIRILIKIEWILSTDRNPLSLITVSQKSNLRIYASEIIEKID